MANEHECLQKGMKILNMVQSEDNGGYEIVVTET